VARLSKRVERLEPRAETQGKFTIDTLTDLALSCVLLESGQLQESDLAYTARGRAMCDELERLERESQEQEKLSSSE